MTADEARAILERVAEAADRAAVLGMTAASCQTSRDYRKADEARQALFEELEAASNEIARLSAR